MIELRTVLCLQVLAACGTPLTPDELDHAVDEHSQVNIVNEVEGCVPKEVSGSVTLSLKSASPYNVSRLTFSPRVKVREGVTIKVLGFTVEPAIVSWSDKVDHGVRVTCRAEVTAASDFKRSDYQADVALPHADELSYWGGFSEPTFTFTGPVRKAPGSQTCPPASLAPPALPPAPPIHESDGFFASAWRTTRGFTKLESVAAAFTLPFFTWLSAKAVDYLFGFLKLFAVITMFTAALFTVLAWVRMLFIWP